MKTIRLYGDMGRQFGREFLLNVASPAEAIRALSATRPGFRAYLRERADAPFRVMVGKADRDEQGLLAPVGSGEVIRIIPMVAGAKSDGVQMMFGAALITAGAFFAQPWMIGMGASMTLGGIAQMLAPTPVVPTADQMGKDAETFSFSSPTLTVGQGGCIPVLYGTMRIGGHVVSAGVDAFVPAAGGFGAMCATDDGVRYGNGDSTPWAWSIAG